MMDSIVGAVRCHAAAGLAHCCVLDIVFMFSPHCDLFSPFIRLQTDMHGGTYQHMSH
jgi:hypothetical protein